MDFFYVLLVFQKKKNHSSPILICEHIHATQLDLLVGSFGYQLRGLGFEAYISDVYMNLS
ncbi:hypothetical protein KFK09_014251 [Dendrobium nobile]|uniref:Uncharacterized protein n=1 Tax=Dendrobium nobile TaxID=94219 RepID=A0A8T3B9J7_DENNO|nr:hypothetical protein KFK09_014251 [Dendrobium nobile]